MLNPVIAMLHNTETDKWHPILFYEAPFPGTVQGVTRHKSKGHHTLGYDTREEALVWCEDNAKKLEEEGTGKVRLCVDLAFPWDGKDMPAMCIWGQYTNVEGNAFFHYRANRI